MASSIYALSEQDPKPNAKQLRLIVMPAPPAPSEDDLQELLVRIVGALMTSAERYGWHK